MILEADWRKKKQEKRKNTKCQLFLPPSFPLHILTYNSLPPAVVFIGRIFSQSESSTH